MINIVLVEPEIPQNSGNIVRTCAAIGAKLYMVKPLGFIMDDKHFKRAGMDYLDFASVSVVDSFQEILDANKNATFYYASTKSQKNYCDVTYPDGCFIVFGKESYGLSENILKNNYDKCVRIPMSSKARSLNLSNSVAIIAYEAMRQQNFESLQEYGQLTGRIENDNY
ncbi:MAG: tRNA (cytidine(34)-2'-O)-methyltransferase [Clostridiales bacterium]|nr:tRNA (cytidine(34)-2'-O)-methyltransferase [Clostridiales bacterium]